MIGILASMAFRAMSAAKAFGQWAGRNPAWAVAAILGLLGAFQTWRLSNAHDARDKALAAAEACEQGRENDRAAYHAAQAEAVRIANAKRTEIETRQKKVTDNAETDIRSRINVAVADARKLRRDQAVGGATGVVSSPEVPGSTSGVDGADSLPVVDEAGDVQACTEAVIKLVGWQETYLSWAEVTAPE